MWYRFQFAMKIDPMAIIYKKLLKMFSGRFFYRPKNFFPFFGANSDNQLLHLSFPKNLYNDWSLNFNECYFDQQKCLIIFSTFPFSGSQTKSVFHQRWAMNFISRSRKINQT